MSTAHHNILSGPVAPPLNPLDKFDPNSPKEPYGTYAPGRSPAWKVHTSRASALSALNQQRGYGGCSLYKLEQGKWVEVCRFQPRAFMRPTCDGCSRSLLVDEEKYMRNPQGGWTYQKTGRKIVSAHQLFERERGRRSKLSHPLTVLTLCDGCKTGMGY